MTIRHATLATFMLLLAIAPGASAQAGKSEPKKSSAPEHVIVAHEKSLFTALAKNDIAAFNKALGSDFVYVDGSMVAKWELSKSAENLKGCTLAKWTVEDAKTTPVGNDLVVLTYKATYDQTCNGKKSPSPVNALSVWRKQGGQWVAVAHSETPVAPAR